MNNQVKLNVDFKELVNKNTLLTEEFQFKILSKLQKTFTNDEEKWYTANFFMYLNYHAINDFVIDLNNVYELIGFASKGNAKRTLANNFIENENFKILLCVPAKRNEKQRGGQNEEKVMLNIDTFKNLCLMAKTKNGKKIREYYVKLENIFNDINKEQFTENQIKLIQMQQEHQIDKQTERHNLLLNTMSNKYVVYILKIFTYENDDYVIKIGQTRNLKERLIEHNYIFKSIGKPVIMDVFEVLRQHDFEQFLLNNTDISNHKTKKLNGFENQMELVLIDKDFTYHHVISIINNNINKFQYADVDIINQEHKVYLEKEDLKVKEKNLEFKIKEIQTRNECIKNTMDLFNISITDAINIVDKVPQVIITPEIEKDIETIQDLPLNQESIDSVNRVNMGITIESKRGARLQKIDMYTHNIVKVYDCINDCLHLENVSRSRITNASNTHQVYKGFRWNLVERDQNPETKYSIGENVIVNNQNVGYIAQLNKEKTIIKNVYKDQKTASFENNYSACSSVSKSVSTGSITQNHIYQLYDNVSSDLKNKYEEINGIPFFMEGGVEKICSQKNVRICLYKNKSDCLKKEKINNNTLNKYLKSGLPYHEFIYKYINNN
jgi:phage anti-repressor protein